MVAHEATAGFPIDRLELNGTAICLLLEFSDLQGLPVHCLLGQGIWGNPLSELRMPGVKQEFAITAQGVGCIPCAHGLLDGFWLYRTGDMRLAALVESLAGAAWAGEIGLLRSHKPNSDSSYRARIEPIIGERSH